jgi:hypothetical protein
MGVRSKSKKRTWVYCTSFTVSRDYVGQGSRPTGSLAGHGAKGLLRNKRNRTYSEPCSLFLICLWGRQFAALNEMANVHDVPIQVD